MLNPKDVLRSAHHRYEVQRLLAQGGMSNVYICRCVTPDPPDGNAQSRAPGSSQGAGDSPAPVVPRGVDLVLKEMMVSYRDPEDQRKAVALFEREASILVELKHRNLPRVFERFKEQQGNRHYFVMEYVEGEDLGKLIARNPDGMSEARVADWGVQVATVLYYLHIQKPPIIFRDLKPSNIMVSRGVVKLIDFGIARKFDHFKKKDTMRIGSPGYAPPEQYSGQTDARSDIYSFGVTLHQLLTGRDPSETQTPFRLPPVRDLKPSVSPQMEAIVARATDMDPGKRFANALEMKRALQAVAGVGVGTGPMTAGLPGLAPGFAPPMGAGAPPAFAITAPRAAASSDPPAALPPSSGAASPPPRFQAPPTNFAAQVRAVAPSSPAPPVTPPVSPAGPAGTPPGSPGGAAVPRGQGTVPTASSAPGAIPAASAAAGDASPGARPGTAAAVRLLQQSPANGRGAGGGFVARLGRLLRTMLVLGLPVAALVTALVWNGTITGRVRDWPVIGPWLGGGSPSASPSPSPEPEPTTVAAWRQAQELIASSRASAAMDFLEARTSREPADGMARVMWNNALAALGGAEPLRLQVIVPQDPIGSDWVRGLALAQRHLNRGGGVGGHPVVLEPVEYPLATGGGSLPAAWLETARSGKVVATLAMLPGDLLREAATAYSAAGIPLLATGCPLDKLVEGVKGLGPPRGEVQDAVWVAKGAVEAGKRVVVVGVGMPASELEISPRPPSSAPSGRPSPSSSPRVPSPGPSAVLPSPRSSVAPSESMAVVDSPHGQVDLEAVVSRNPDLVVVLGDPVRVAKWVAVAREMGLKKPILTTYALLLDPAVQPPGMEAGGLMVVTPYAPEAGDLAGERFALSLAGEFGRAKPGYWAAAGYETLAGVGTVLSSAGGDPSPQGWRKVLADDNLRLPSPMGTLGIPTEGGVPRRWSVLRLQGGAWTTVKASF